jgi:hypothetical protein
VSCAEWPRLRPWVELRLERGDGEGAPADNTAPEHLVGCAECRRRAYALDPSLVFLKLREDGPAEIAETGEIEAMRERVAALRTMRAMRLPGHVGRGARPTGWRWAAAALLAGVALAQGVRSPLADPLAKARPAEQSAAVPAELALQPVVEELGRPEARVYQFAGDDLSVVMIVDETLDF